MSPILYIALLTLTCGYAIFGGRRFERLAAGTFRHRDHRFEWTRAEFADWAGRVSADYGYAVRLQGVGVDDREVGPPTQLAVFTRREPGAAPARDQGSQRADDAAAGRTAVPA